MPVVYKSVNLDYGYRMDIQVEDSVIVEIKTVEEINPVHVAQILTYMKFGKKSTGLLINFNVVLLKNGIRRFRL